MNNLTTVVLIDGRPIPTCLRLSEQERAGNGEYITWYGTGKAKNFKFVRMERNQKNESCAVYRAVNADLNDKDFERIAKEETEKVLHPENFKTANALTPLNDSERAELEMLRAKVGSVKR